MSKSSLMRLSDARCLIEILGECRELGDDSETWWVHVLRRLCKLVGAELSVGGEVTRQVGGSVLSLGGTSWGWENGFNQEAWLEGLADPDMRFSPLFGAYFGRPRLREAAAALTRPDLVEDRPWMRSVYYQQVHRVIGLEHTLISFSPLACSGQFTGVTLSREAGMRRDFSARDRTLIHEAVVAIAPLIGGPLARFREPAPADLAPRVRQVLDCLLEGDSDKQVAARLGISPFTVNQYTKRIFRHFGVQSRAELLARWVRRARRRPDAAGTNLL